MIHAKKNFDAIEKFDTFWSSVRSIGGMRTVKQSSRRRRTKSVPINAKVAPTGSIYRGAKGADAVHILAELGKGAK